MWKTRQDRSREGAGRLWADMPPSEGRWLREQLAQWAGLQAPISPAEVTLLSADGDRCASRAFWARHLRNDARLTSLLLTRSQSTDVLARRRAVMPPGQDFSGAGALYAALGNLGLAGARRAIVEDVVGRLFPLGASLLSEMLSLRRHSVAVGVAAAAVAREVGSVAPGALFVAGLLHDVGKALLLEHGGKAYAALAQGEGDLSDRERRALGFDHGALAADAAEAMGLARPLISVLRDHHLLSQRLNQVDWGGHLLRLACLSMGEALAEGLGYEDGGRLEVEARGAVIARLARGEAASVLGISRRRLEVLAQHVDRGARSALRALAPGKLGRLVGVPRGLSAIWGDGGPPWRDEPLAMATSPGWAPLASEVRPRACW